MANLAISTICNQTCPYCFARDHHADHRSNGRFLAVEDLQVRLAFLTRSGIDQVRMMGGEPTLHPHFVELAERARKAGFKIIVFSNGRMPESVLSYLASLPAAEVTVLINVNEPRDSGQNAHAERQVAIQRLGERAMLGLNICRVNFQPDFLLSTIAETGCQHKVRLGIAHPCLSGDNQYVTPNQYVAIGAKIARFVRTAARSGVTVEFDCGFVRCMFSDADMETLKASGTDVGWRCNPILDVDIEGRVIHCYPLSRLGTLPLTMDADAQTLRDAFVSRVRVYRQAGVFPECSSCPFKANGECPGGCLSATIRRFRRTPFRAVVPAQGGGL